MKRALSYVLFAFMAIGLLLSTGCFEETAYNVQQLKELTEVTFADGDPFLKTVR